MALLVLLAALILAGLGLVASFLFVPAATLFALWLAGWAVRIRGGRWYAW